MNASEMLSAANDCHDDEPVRGAELLRSLDAAALATDERPLLAFLLNHVLGEKLGCWAEADLRQTALLGLARTAGQTPPAVLLRQAAVAAHLGGADDGPARCATLCAALAEATGAPPAQALQLVRLAAAAFTAPGLDAATAGALVLSAMAPLLASGPNPWQQPGGLDSAAAAQCNNIASELVERPLPALQDPTLREALAQAAANSQQLWQRAGTWVHWERVCYLRALCASALGDAAGARAHAAAGLALLDVHDGVRDGQHEQAVDRAFLEMELAWACDALGLAYEAAAAHARAEALAADFGDAGLTAWFRQLSERNRLLAGR